MLVNLTETPSLHSNVSGIHVIFGHNPSSPAGASLTWLAPVIVLLFVTIVCLAGFICMYVRRTHLWTRCQKVDSKDLLLPLDVPSELKKLTTPLGVMSLTWDVYLGLQKSLALSGWCLERKWTFASPIMEYKEDHGKTGRFLLEMPLWAEPCDGDTEYWLFHSASASESNEKVTWSAVRKLDRSCLDLKARKLCFVVDEMCKYGVVACGNFKEDMMLLIFAEPSVDSSSVTFRVFIERDPGDQQVDDQIRTHVRCRSLPENAEYCSLFRLKVKNCEVKLALFSVAPASDFALQDPAVSEIGLTLKIEEFSALTADNSIGPHASWTQQLSHLPSEHPHVFHLYILDCEGGVVRQFPIFWPPRQQVQSESYSPRGVHHSSHQQGCRQAYNCSNETVNAHSSLSISPSHLLASGSSPDTVPMMTVQEPPPAQPNPIAINQQILVSRLLILPRDNPEELTPF
eukprot:m.171700 g.171700  ORF g.171700 m.171700 type:complete len:458 (+) comp39070_c1_seq10:694-2067(+)